MPQTTQATGLGPILKIDYVNEVRYDISMRTKGWTAFNRQTTPYKARAKDTKFGIVTSPNQGPRSYGANDPGIFATTAGKMGVEDVTVNYVKMYAPTRITWEVYQEATSAGALTDGVALELDGLATSFGRQLERSLWTGDGRDVLFMIDQDTPGISATGANIDRYGGYSGQELGLIVESMNLVNMEVSFAATVGGAARDTGAVRTILTAIATKNTESITWASAAVAALAAGDSVYRSRQDAAGVQGISDGMYGLPAMCDDYSLIATYQGLTTALAPSFAAKLLGNGGVNRPLTEDLLSLAVGIAQQRGGGKPTDEKGNMTSAVFCHIFTERAFASLLTGDRRYSAPTLWTPKGFKPISGADIELMSHEGMPFISGQLALRNSAFIVDLASQFIVSNGPAEGGFIDEGTGKAVRVTGGPQFEYAWWAFVNGASKGRNRNVRINDLETTQAA